MWLMQKIGENIDLCNKFTINADIIRYVHGF